MSALIAGRTSIGSFSVPALRVDVCDDSLPQIAAISNSNSFVSLGFIS
jgi:hypothetical protein